MKAMILAAGRGNRLRPITDLVPKPLIRVRGKCLIEHHLLALAAMGIEDVIINVSYLAARIQAALGSGQRYGLNIHYSYEAEALETGGGILNALPLLGDQPFIVVNSDILTDYPFQTLLRAQDQLLAHNALAHLVLIDNPPERPLGDFDLVDGNVVRHPQNPYTYSGMGLYHPQLFTGCTTPRFPLLQVFLAAISQGQLSGEYYAGCWHDVGTLDRLAQVNRGWEYSEERMLP